MFRFFGFTGIIVQVLGRHMTFECLGLRRKHLSCTSGVGGGVVDRAQGLGRNASFLHCGVLGLKRASGLLFGFKTAGLREHHVVLKGGHSRNSMGAEHS